VSCTRREDKDSVPDERPLFVERSQGRRRVLLKSLLFKKHVSFRCQPFDNMPTQSKCYALAVRCGKKVGALLANQTPGDRISCNERSTVAITIQLYKLGLGGYKVDLCML
jgi:hypothetical protein